MDEKQMQHGIDWTGQDVSGMIATEKFRGCRAYWDGQDLWSRGGMQVQIPASWREALPVGVPLDFELYDGIDGESRCAVALRYGRFTPTMQLIIFDCPGAKGNYTERMKYAEQYNTGPIISAKTFPISTWSECLALFKQITGRKGEGLMLRKPTLAYTSGRTCDMLKVKYSLVVSHG